MQILIRHIGFRLLNLTALLAVALHLCLAYLPPVDWYFLQWMDLLTPLGVVLVGLFVVIRYPGHRIAFALNGLLLIGLFFGFSSDLRYTSSSTQPSNLRMVTFNAGGFDNKVANVKKAAEGLHSLQADVVVFQEFGLMPWWHNGDTLAGVMSEALGLPYYNWFRHPYNVFGLAIFSRFPILGSEPLFLPVNVGNGAAFNQIDHPNGAFDLIHLHLESFNYGHRLDTVDGFWQKLNAFPMITSETYARQHQQLVKILGAGMSSPNPVLIAGDFNNVPGSYYYKELDREFTDAFSAAGSGWGYTHTEWHIPLRIDQQWASEHWEIHYAQRASIIGSDHRALVVDYQLK